MGFFQNILAPFTGSKERVNEPKQLVQRGYSLYSISQLMGITGQDKFGENVNGTYELPWFKLSPEERIEIAKQSSFIFGVVTSRMHRVGSRQFKVVPDLQEEDRIVAQLKLMKSTYDDFKNSDELKFKMAAALIRNEIKKELPDILDDLSNFNRALVRFNRRAKMMAQGLCNEAEDFMAKPNQRDDFEDIAKKWVFDSMVHGSSFILKNRPIPGGEIAGYSMLPGGTIFPMKAEFEPQRDFYVQMIPGRTALIYDPTELVSSVYAPVTATEFGLVPLDALVNKVAEELLSERYWAEQADGTKPPEKLIALEQRHEIGQMATPMDPQEQKRVERKLNIARKEAIRTITGTGPITVLDISKRDTLTGQLERVKEIKKDIALVFNMTNMEINEAGSDSTSGRETSESQQKIEEAKGTFPMIKAFQDSLTRELIWEKFGRGCRLKLMGDGDELELLETVKRKLETGAFSVNQVLVEDLNREPFDKDEFDFPPNTQNQQVMINGGEVNQSTNI